MPTEISTITLEEGFNSVLIKYNNFLENKDFYHQLTENKIVLSTEYKDKF